MGLNSAFDSPGSKEKFYFLNSIYYLFIWQNINLHLMMRLLLKKPILLILPINGSNIDQSDFSLLFNALKSLRNNDSFVLQKLDKWSRVVILNRRDYVNKMAILNDISKFTRPDGVDEFDKTVTQEQRIQH